MSTIKVDNLQTTGGAGLYPARAWVNFNGQGTVSILDDGNVSSITDNGTGYYTLNFSTNTPTSNQALTGSAMGQSGVAYDANPVARRISTSKSTSNYALAVSAIVGSASGPPFDSADVSAICIA